MSKRRCAGVVVAAALVAVSCSKAEQADLADITPAIARMCRTVDADLAGLADEPVGPEALSAVTGLLLGFATELPDQPTEAGRADVAIGDEIRDIGSVLNSVASGYDLQRVAVDPPTAEFEIRAGFDFFDAATSEFGVEQCISTAVLDEVIIPQISGVSDFVASIEPTGDYAVDVNDACIRLRGETTDAAMANATDPNARFLIFARTRGVAERFRADIERFDPPSDVASAHATLLAATDRYVASVTGVESARLTSEEALDAALLEFEAAEERFWTLVGESATTC